MTGRLTIRRLRVNGLVPRDHPAPDDLKARVIAAARASLAPALARAVEGWSGPAVLRIQRLDVDVSLGTIFEPEAFAELVARKIVAALRRAEEEGGSAEEGQGVYAFPTRAAYLAALIEALAAGQAMDCWWLRDADGLRFLTRQAAIRTALLADPAVAPEALAGLSPPRLISLLTVLGPVEAERVLDGIANIGSKTMSAETCVAAIAAAAGESEVAASPLALYLRAIASQPALAGVVLAAAARLWSRVENFADRRPGATSEEVLAALADGEGGVLPAMPEPARIAIARHFATHVLQKTKATRSPVVRVFSRFGGLLLLVPNLAMEEIAEALAGWSGILPPDTAALVGYATLGLCSGRTHFAEFLAETVWRELFGLDSRATSASLLDRLSAATDREWESLSTLGNDLNRLRDARFLLAPPRLIRSRAAGRTLARLARATLDRLVRRLANFGDASAPFLWERLLGCGASLERRPEGWEARLSRPPLDVLLSLSRLAEGRIELPSGALVSISRVAP